MVVAGITNNKADSDNNSLGDGGGIRVQAGTVTLKNTIVAGNFNEDGVTDAADDISGTIDPASSFNLIGTGGAGGLTNGVNNNQVGVAISITRCQKLRLIAEALQVEMLIAIIGEV